VLQLLRWMKSTVQFWQWGQHCDGGNWLPLAGEYCESNVWSCWQGCWRGSGMHQPRLSGVVAVPFCGHAQGCSCTNGTDRCVLRSCLQLRLHWQLSGSRLHTRNVGTCWSLTGRCWLCACHQHNRRRKQRGTECTLIRQGS
jgi:hypothetical protein